ncbi:MAG: isochorismatase family protein [Alphaproteobacteria bacterium]|nr:isochorismatase family protein [Alphaproteobacteria bacterium]
MSSDFEDHCWKDLVDGEILELYQSYHRDTFIGPNPALLVIDLYNRAYAGGPGPVADANRKSPGACGDNAWNAIAPTVKVIAAARRAGIPVAYCSGSVRKGRVQSTFRSTSERQSAADDFEIKQEFAPQSGDIVIRKERASAFYGTPLSAQLRMLGVQSLIAFGESTSGCVRASVVDGYSDGFKVSVVEECTFDRSWLSHKVNLFDLHHKYADVMHVEQVLAHLDGLAAGS